MDTHKVGSPALVSWYKASNVEYQGTLSMIQANNIPYPNDSNKSYASASAPAKY